MGHKKQRTMLYKHPGPHKMFGSSYDYVVISKLDEEEYNAALADGWCERPEDAFKAKPTEEQLSETAVKDSQRKRRGFKK